MTKRRLLIALLLALLVPPVVRAQDAPQPGKLYIPRLMLAAPVEECAIVDGQHDTRHLGGGICHLAGTATIAHDWARIVLAGHTPGGFEGLHLLRPGDQVIVWDAHAVEVYVVQVMQVVPVSDTRWLMPTESETLTLITCAGDQRLIVHAIRE